MQRVRYSEYEKIPEDKRESDFRATHKLVDRGSAYFMEFGVDFQELDYGVGNFSTAIIKTDDGQIKNIPVEQVEFL